MLFYVYLLSFVCSHTFYVSICEINYAPEEESLQVSWRLFADDLEWALTPPGDEYFYIGHSDYNSDSLLTAYFDQRFYLLVDDERVSPKYIGHEFQGEEIYCYFEIGDYRLESETLVYIDALSELYAEQQHYVHHQNDRNLISTTVLTKDSPTTKLTLE